MYGVVMSTIRILLRSKEDRTGCMTRASFGGFLEVALTSNMVHRST
uniref:Uncharacterized protein n=1 Tax=Arundo donax TaxID=35708 RepID=A0A0A9E2Z4_ARUDO